MIRDVYNCDFSNKTSLKKYQQTEFNARTYSLLLDIYFELYVERSYAEDYNLYSAM